MPTVPDSTPSRPVHVHQLPLVLCPECEAYLVPSLVDTSKTVPGVTMTCKTAECRGIEVLVHTL